MAGTARSLKHLPESTSLMRVLSCFGGIDVGSTSARKPLCPARVGPTHEWYLDLGKAFRYFAFEFGAGLGQPVVIIAPPLSQPRLVTVGPVGDPVAGDGSEQVMTQLPAASGIVGGSELQQGLSRFQGLHGT